MLKFIIFLISLFIVLFFIKSFSISYKLIKSNKWKEVSAILTKYETYWLQTNTTGAATLSAWWKNWQYLDVNYTFNIGSKQYTGDKVDITPHELFPNKKGKEFLDLWVWDTVTVKYDYKAPNNNYMVTELDDSIYLSIFKTLLSLFLLWINYWYVFIKS
jgi:hypothetical protein